jgi:hypothetical protein
MPRHPVDLHDCDEPLKRYELDELTSREAAAVALDALAMLRAAVARRLRRWSKLLARARRYAPRLAMRRTDPLRVVRRQGQDGPVWSRFTTKIAGGVS